VQENSSEIYDVKSNKFSVGPQMPVDKRRAIRPVTLEDGRIVIAGGEDTSARPVSEVEIYDPKINKFESVGNMLYSRKWIEPIKLDNGLIYIIGGNYNTRSSFLAGQDKLNCEILNPKTNEFKKVKTCTQILKYNYKPILLNNGELLVVGGNTPNLMNKQRRKIEIINTKEIK